MPSFQVVPGTPGDSEIGGSGSSEQGLEKGTPGRISWRNNLWRLRGNSPRSLQGNTGGGVTYTHVTNKSQSLRTTRTSIRHPGNKLTSPTIEAKSRCNWFGLGLLGSGFREVKRHLHGGLINRRRADILLKIFFAHPPSPGKFDDGHGLG